MRNTLWKPLALLLVLAVATAAQAQLRVVATIHPYFDLARQIAGGEAEVIRLVPPGASPHTFAPTPRQMSLLAQADVIVMNGGYGIDDWLMDMIEASGTDARLVTMLDAIPAHELIAGEHPHDHDHGAEAQARSGDDDHLGEHDHEEQDHDHDHDEQDHDHDHDDDDDDDEQDHEEADRLHQASLITTNPHVWLDPQLMLHGVRAIASALESVDPQRGETYRSNAAALSSDIRELDAELTQMLIPIRGEPFVPFHDAWPYFARRYRLDLVLEIEPFPGREPSPAYLVEVISELNRVGARAIFVEPQLSRRPAEVVAETAGLQLYAIDPIGGTDGRETYQELMRDNASIVLQALGE